MVVPLKENIKNILTHFLGNQLLFEESSFSYSNEIFRITKSFEQPLLYIYELENLSPILEDV